MKSLTERPKMYINTVWLRHPRAGAELPLAMYKKALRSETGQPYRIEGTPKKAPPLNFFAHRAHASTVGVTRFVPVAAGGFFMQKEIQ
jgi:hypothetical protein